MEYFKLPQSTVVNKAVPKNSFHSFINNKQKKLFTEVVDRIIWSNKLSTETINLPHEDITEIELFTVQLKVKDKIDKVLEAIDKSIPYHIVFVIIHNKEIKISTTAKHTHPLDPSKAVIDHTFVSDWHDFQIPKYKIVLKESIDSVFNQLCIQLSGASHQEGLKLTELVEREREKLTLNKEINAIRAKIKKSSSFKEKVEYNTLLNKKLVELDKLTNVQSRK